MLDKIIDLKIRLDLSMNQIAQRIEEKSDEGFASAETIALAVAGVLIVGAVYGVFKTRIDTAVKNMFDSIDGGF